MLICTAPVQAITIDLVPELQAVDLNTPVSVDVTISGLGDATAPSLGSFDLNILYDPNILSFSGSSGISFGQQLDLFNLGSVQMIDNSTLGIVNLLQVSLDFADDLNSLQLSSFTMATLTFDTLFEGVSPLSVTANALGDANGNPLTADLNGAEIKVTSTATIPEPTTGFLLAMGLAGLYWRKSTQRRAI
jgi:hypothetical protein